MSNRVPKGLVKRGGVWHIDKRLGNGQRLCKSTGTSEVEEAERYMIHVLEEARKVGVYGERPYRTWRHAATKYLEESEKATLAGDAAQLNILDPYIGNLSLEKVHMGTLEDFIRDRKASGVKNRTINSALQVVRHILRLAADEWMDGSGMTWLLKAPKVKLLHQKDSRKPYPISWEEQEKLLQHLPGYLQDMVLFKVNTGTRAEEVCGLRWEWEVDVPELNTSVFLIPWDKVKNREERLVVVNSIAREAIERNRGLHPTYVFSVAPRARGNRRNRIHQMSQRSWRDATMAAGLDGLRVHDLKHTYGRRLTAAGVPFEDRQELLGHKNQKITAHYSAADVDRLLELSERVCVMESRKSHASGVIRRQLRLLRSA